MLGEVKVLAEMESATTSKMDGGAVKEEGGNQVKHPPSVPLSREASHLYEKMMRDRTIKDLLILNTPSSLLDQGDGIDEDLELPMKRKDAPFLSHPNQADVSAHLSSSANTTIASSSPSSSSFSDTLPPTTSTHSSLSGEERGIKKRKVNKEDGETVVVVVKNEGMANVEEQAIKEDGYATKVEEEMIKGDGHGVKDDNMIKEDSVEEERVSDGAPIHPSSQSAPSLGAKVGGPDALSPTPPPTRMVTRRASGAVQRRSVHDILAGRPASSSSPSPSSSTIPPPPSTIIPPPSPTTTTTLPATGGNVHFGRNTIHAYPVHPSDALSIPPVSAYPPSSARPKRSSPWRHPVALGGTREEKISRRADAIAAAEIATKEAEQDLEESMVRWQVRAQRRPLVHLVQRAHKCILTRDWLVRTISTCVNQDDESDTRNNLTHPLLSSR